VTNDSDPTDDPAITGVPPETPDAVRPSATGLVTGPVDDETDVDVAEVFTGDEGSDDEGGEQLSIDQVLEGADGGVESSTLDAPQTCRCR
jgi:hypothetical protein